MQEEILNIDYHVKQLVLKALNKYKNDYDAAIALGYSKRQLLRFKKDFNIKSKVKRVTTTVKEYFFEEK